MNNAFETFASLHPAEAFDLDKAKFCKYVREKISKDITDDQIEQLINEQR